jgi:hypothetical protein
MTQESASGSAVAERIRTANLAVGGNSPVTAMLANALRERKPLADTGELYDSVQEAENAASAFVFVPPGTFNESVTIDTVGLTLLGSGRATLIDGGTINHAIVVDSANVTIDSLSVKTSPGSGNAYSGIRSGAGADSATIKNVTVRYSDGVGIDFRDGTDNSYLNCTVESSDGASLQATAERTTCSGCIVESSGETGIKFSLADDSVIANNIVKSCADDGILVNGNDMVVGSNRVINSANDGIVTGTSSADSIIYNNRISDSGGSDINDTDGTTTTLDGNLTGASN